MQHGGFKLTRQPYKFSRLAIRVCSRQVQSHVRPGALNQCFSRAEYIMHSSRMNQYDVMPVGCCTAVSKQWGNAHSGWPHGLARLWLWHGTLMRPPYQRRRGPLRDRAPEQSSGTPSRAISTHGRFEPCKAVVGERWEYAHSECTRGLARLWRRHGTLLGVP